MVYFYRERFIVGNYGKLSKHKYEPYHILKALRSNAYLVELPEDLYISEIF